MSLEVPEPAKDQAPFFADGDDLALIRRFEKALVRQAAAELWIREYWQRNPKCNQARRPSPHQVALGAKVGYGTARRALDILRDRPAGA